MQRKSVIFIADSLDSAHRYQEVLSALDADVRAGSSAQFEGLVKLHPECDLVVCEARGEMLRDGAHMEKLLTENGCSAVLIIVDAEQLDEVRLPMSLKSDFIVHGATAGECSARIRQLLWPGNEGSQAEFISIDNLTINLATYQVQVNGNPLDLTYLEYALLSFLVTHPGRTYSRDALLSRVWGFDYYGGSRTVDVHVRRVRAKLGPELSQRLETVRGVGYLWMA